MNKIKEYTSYITAELLLLDIPKEELLVLICSRCKTHQLIINQKVIKCSEGICSWILFRKYDQRVDFLDEWKKGSPHQMIDYHSSLSYFSSDSSFYHTTFTSLQRRILQKNLIYKCHQQSLTQNL
jgi:hypothetical protein